MKSAHEQKVSRSLSSQPAAWSAGWCELQHTKQFPRLAALAVMHAFSMAPKHWSESMQLLTPLRLFVDPSTPCPRAVVRIKRLSNLPLVYLRGSGYMCGHT
jgi:predicted nucleic acid-binding Zn ribbon protein